jgi:hypothetical protein
VQRIAMVISIFLAAVAFAQPPASAPAPPPAPPKGGEFNKLLDSCNGFAFGQIASCAELLFTGDPLHIAAGSMAPQNGFGLGASYTFHWTPANWRNSLDVDGVVSPNGSSRVGGYLTLVWIRRPKIVTTMGPPPKPSRKSTITIKEQPVFHVYLENDSLHKVNYFGIGPNTSDTALSFFGIRETIAGGNVVFPIFKPLNMSLYAEGNARFTAIHSDLGQSSPSIEQIYTAATAPGLLSQPGYGQLGQGVRIRPALANDYIRLNYSVALQEFIGSGSAAPSFRRLAIDLQHQFAFYQNTRRLLPADSNGPDSCIQDPTGGDRSCPPMALPKAPGNSRNLEGSINVGLTINASYLGAGQSVPFYYQPTLGGSDINGNPALSSYQDYRFRGPDTILFRTGFEHSLGSRWPLGVTAMLDEGKVALTPGDLGFTHLLHTYSAGLTLRAGGFPMMFLLFSWGGREGTHNNVRMDTSLLGGSYRPSLF